MKLAESQISDVLKEAFSKGFRTVRLHTRHITLDNDISFGADMKQFLCSYGFTDANTFPSGHDGKTHVGFGYSPSVPIEFQGTYYNRYWERQIANISKRILVKKL